MTAKNSNSLIYPLTPISFILSPYHMQSLSPCFYHCGQISSNIWWNLIRMFWVLFGTEKQRKNIFFVDDTNQIDHLIWLSQDWSRGEFAGTMTLMDRLWYMICWCVRYLLSLIKHSSTLVSLFSTSKVYRYGAAPLSCEPSSATVLSPIV